MIFPGAGKTTTFNILIGDIAPSSGTAIIAGHDIRTDLNKVNHNIQNHNYAHCNTELHISSNVAFVNLHVS